MSGTNEYPQAQLFTSQKQRGVSGTPAHRTGRRPSDCRTYEVKNLTERHHQMKRMALQGMAKKDIATALGVSEATVLNVLNSAMMRKELEIARSALDKEAYDVSKEINRLHPVAMRVLEDILEDENAPQALKARVAMDNLSRGGFSPILRGSITMNHTFSADEIEQIKRDALAAGASMGHVVDAEYSEIGPEGALRPCSEDVGIMAIDYDEAPAMIVEHEVQDD